MAFSVTNRGFRCFRCGISGDTIDLIALLGNMTKAEAIKWLEGHEGIINRPPESKTGD